MPRPRLLATLLATHLALLVATAADAAPRAAWPARPIELALAHAHGHSRTLDVELAGGRHTMLFDTGGGVTAISPALARQLGCATTGTNVGLRMTGQRIDAPLCRDIEIRIGGQVIRTEAAVIDLAAILGKGGPQVDGMVSLATLDGLAVSLDLAHDRLWIESKRSLAARTKRATTLAFRRATGVGGGQLSPFVGVTTPGGIVWLELDSGHGGTTFVAPGAAALLGVAESAASGEADLQLSSALSVHVPVITRKDLVFDGVLSAATVTRATWTLDLSADTLWVGAIAPILQLPATAPRAVRPLASDPTGVYEVALVVQGTRAPHLLGVRRDGTRWIGEMRRLGEDETVRLEDVKVDGATLTVTLPLRPPTPMQITFEGLDGRGTWGDPKARGGAVTATKRQ